MLNRYKLGILTLIGGVIATQAIGQTEDHDFAGGNTGVGEVIVSVLQPVDFRKIYGPDWAVLDGQNVTSQPIAKYLPTQLRTEDSTFLPDARGRFLRMPNHGESGDGRDTEGDRHVGHFQADTIAKHGHSYSGIQRGGGDRRGGRAGNDRFSALLTNEHATLTSGVVGKEETRPANIAINYYVRVACTTGGKC